MTGLAVEAVEKRLNTNVLAKLEGNRITFCRPENRAPFARLQLNAGEGYVGRELNLHYVHTLGKGALWPGGGKKQFCLKPDTEYVFSIPLRQKKGFLGLFKSFEPELPDEKKAEVFDEEGNRLIVFEEVLKAFQKHLKYK